MCFTSVIVVTWTSHKSSQASQNRSGHSGDLVIHSCCHALLESTCQVLEKWRYSMVLQFLPKFNGITIMQKDPIKEPHTLHNDTSPTGLWVSNEHCSMFKRIKSISYSLSPLISTSNCSYTKYIFFSLT